MIRVLAVDIGATKFAAAIVDAAGEAPRRTELPTGTSPTASLEHLLDAVRTGDVDAVGIGTAGPLDRDLGTVSPVNIPAWRDFPLVDAVRRRVPDRPVAMAGDAQCVALGEWRRRPPSGGAHALLGIVVSTGIGGGLVRTATRISGPAATPATSGTSRSTRAARCARAARPGVSRPSPAGRP